MAADEDEAERIGREMSDKTLFERWQQARMALNQAEHDVEEAKPGYEDGAAYRLLAAKSDLNAISCEMRKKETPKGAK